MGTKTINMQDFDAKVQKLGSVGAALNWARENGYELPPANRELPPVEPQGGLKTAEEASTMAADTGEEDTGTEDTGAEDTGAMGGLDLANLDFSKIKSNPDAFFKTLVDANLAAEKNRAASAKRMYEEADKRILEKYAGPSQSERLFALSRAMLSPTKTPGFAGFLGNVTGALSENAKAAREAEQLRQQKQFENYLQYQKGELERAAAQPKTVADLVAKYINAQTAAAKANAPVRGIAVGNRLVNPYTNQDIEPPVGTIKTYKGRKYEYLGGGDQYDQNNWREVR